MTYKNKGSIDCLYDAILEDILKASEADLLKDLTEVTGKSSDELHTEFSNMLEKAKDQIIKIKMAQLASAKKNVVTFPVKNPPNEAKHSISTLTLAARNARRPLGFTDPSVDEDLRELRSEDWNDE